MPQEKEKKKRKNIEFNCFVFKSEYSIRSLLHWGFAGWPLRFRVGGEMRRKDKVLRLITMCLSLSIHFNPST